MESSTKLIRSWSPKTNSKEIAEDLNFSNSYETYDTIILKRMSQKTTIGYLLNDTRINRKILTKHGLKVPRLYRKYLAECAIDELLKENNSFVAKTYISSRPPFICNKNTGNQDAMYDYNKFTKYVTEELDRHDKDKGILIEEYINSIANIEVLVLWGAVICVSTKTNDLHIKDKILQPKYKDIFDKCEAIAKELKSDLLCFTLLFSGRSFYAIKCNLTPNIEISDEAKTFIFDNWAQKEYYSKPRSNNSIDKYTLIGIDISQDFNNNFYITDVNGAIALKSFQRQSDVFLKRLYEIFGDNAKNEVFFNPLFSKYDPFFKSILAQDKNNYSVLIENAYIDYEDKTIFRLKFPDTNIYPKTNSFETHSTPNYPKFLVKPKMSYLGKGIRMFNVNKLESIHVPDSFFIEEFIPSPLINGHCYSTRVVLLIGKENHILVSEDITCPRKIVENLPQGELNSEQLLSYISHAESDDTDTRMFFLNTTESLYKFLENKVLPYL